jgi:hypothetical protein
MNDDIHAAVRARQPDYPPEQSMAGYNSYSFGCKTVGFSPGYCVCLNKISAYERDGKLTTYPECEKAIRNKDCPALAMRQEERVAGKALYFLDRNILREEMDKHFKDAIPALRPSAKPATTLKSAPKPAPTPASQPTPLASAQDGYAAAINAAIAEAATEQPKQEEPKVAAPSPSEQIKRPSLLEMTRAKMGKSN